MRTTFLPVGPNLHQFQRLWLGSVFSQSASFFFVSGPSVPLPHNRDATSDKKRDKNLLGLIYLLLAQLVSLNFSSQTNFKLISKCKVITATVTVSATVALRLPDWNVRFGDRVLGVWGCWSVKMKWLWCQMISLSFIIPWTLATSAARPDSEVTMIEKTTGANTHSITKTLILERFIYVSAENLIHSVHFVSYKKQKHSR